MSLGFNFSGSVKQYPYAEPSKRAIAGERFAEELLALREFQAEREEILKHKWIESKRRTTILGLSSADGLDHQASCQLAQDPAEHPRSLKKAPLMPPREAAKG